MSSEPRGGDGPAEGSNVPSAPDCDSERPGSKYFIYESSALRGKGERKRREQMFYKRTKSNGNPKNKFGNYCPYSRLIFLGVGADGARTTTNFRI